MKKLFLIFAVFCFLFISCLNNIATTTTQNLSEENGILNDKVFYLGELREDDGQYKYYLHFFNGVEYGIEYNRYSWTKFKTGNSYKATTIYNKDGTIDEVTVSDKGITFPSGRFAPIVTNPELVKIIKNLPVRGNY